MGGITTPPAGTVTTTLRGSVDLGSLEAHDIFVRGSGSSKRAFTHSHGSWFYVVNVSNVDSPTVVGSLRDVTNLSPVSQYECSTGSRYIAVLSDSWLTIMDVQTETAPAVVTKLDNPVAGPYLGLMSTMNDIVVVDNRYAYVTASTPNSVVVIDLVDPTNPVVVGAVTNATTLNGPGGLAYDGANTLWVSAGTRLTAVDITTRASPSVVGSAVEGNGHSVARVAIYGTKAITVETGPSNYMSSWNITTRTAPSWTSSLTNAGMDRPLGVTLTPDGQVACVSCQGDVGCVAFVNTSNPASLSYIGRVTQPVAGGPGAPGSGELYHAYASVWDEDQQGFWVAVAGSGHATFVKLDRTGETLDAGNGPRIA